VQLLLAGKFHNFENLATDGSFILHYIIELDMQEQSNHPIHEI